LLHVYLATRAQTKTSLSLLSNNIFDYKLRTIEAENPEQVKKSQPQLKMNWYL